MERGPFWRAGLLPESPWEAHPVTIIANLGEPIGESRMNNLGPIFGRQNLIRRHGTTTETRSHSNLFSSFLTLEGLFQPSDRLPHSVEMRMD